jgi:hypothetical protein
LISIDVHRLIHRPGEQHKVGGSHLVNWTSKHPEFIWATQLNGGIWTKGGAASGEPPVVHTTQGGSPQPGDPNSRQRGSLELTNMTMETFEQGDSSSIPVSHIAWEYLLPSAQKQVSQH